MSDTTTGGMRRGAALMASGTAVSRVLGLLRAQVLILAIASTGEAADAFQVANTLPNILFMLLAGGVLNAILVPQVVRAYRRDAGQEYVDRLLSVGFVILAGSTLVLTAAAPLLVHLYAKSGSPDQVALAVTFAYWCLPQLFFYGAYALLGQVLNARGSFGPYMWAPVVNNVVSIAGFVVFIVVFGGFGTSGLTDASAWGPSQIALLAGSATIGVVAQALVLLPAMRRAGVHLRFRWGLRGSGLGRASAVATWTFVGLGIGQLGFLVVTRVAVAAPHAADPGSVVAGPAAYANAFTVFMLPHSLVTVSLATALFTRLSQQAHHDDVDGVRASMSYGLRVVGLFTIIAAAVIAVLAVPVTSIVLLSDQKSVPAVSGVVLAMIVGLPAFGAWSLSQRTYYAYEDAKGMVPIQLAMAGVVVGGTLLGRALLPPSSWVAGAGASMSASYLLGALVAQWHLRRRLGTVDGPRVVRTHARALLAAVVAVGVGLLTLRVLQAALSDGLVAALVECAVVGGLMSAVYVGGLKVLRVEELDGLLGPVIGRLRAGRG
ncbi:murein biosynthesis integral membrane protein MurJ [Cellulomonas sp. URHB0016]